jgi:predicted aldo/keto reductase-like oxidoreductase
MLFRRFGRTGLTMPVLTSGGMRYQQSWDAEASVTDDSQANVAAIVQRAIELGIVHIETARGYGTSEKQLGQILPYLRRDKVIIQTKIAPTEDPQEFETNFFDSLGRLHIDWVDLLALHGVNDRQVLGWALDSGGCLERALNLKVRGYARHVGFSTHASTDVIVDAMRDGRFEYANIHYYWAFQNNAPVLREAAARDMGILIISPTDKGGQLYQPSRLLCELTAPLSPMVYNDIWCLAHAEVHTLAIGNQRPTDFDEHVRAVQLFCEHATDPRALIAPVEARLHSRLVRVFGDSWANTWHQGLGGWQEMPDQINVLEILRLYNLAVAFDMLEFARSRYNLLENGGHWFPGRKASNIGSLDWSGALRRSPHASVIPQRLAEAHTLLGGPAQKRLQRDN